MSRPRAGAPWGGSLYDSPAVSDGTLSASQSSHTMLAVGFIGEIGPGQSFAMEYSIGPLIDCSLSSDGLLLCESSVCPLLEGVLP